PCCPGKVSLPEVEPGPTAQAERLRNAAVPLTHLDAHKHVHAYPPVFAIVARLAGRFGIPVVRVPYERWSPTSGDVRSRGLALQALLNAAMRPWARRNYRTAASHHVRTPHFVRRLHTGM